MGRNFVDIRHAKSKDYRRVLEEIQKEGKCPFCPENFKWHSRPVLKEVGGWFITKTNWPYENARHHFLLICKFHWERFSELSLQDLSDVGRLVNWTCCKFKIKGGALALRFGDTAYTGATVKHLHFHLIVPKKGKVVNFPIG